MTKNDAYSLVSTRETPQTEPIDGTVQNSAGGQSFAVDDWTRLNRFLILGTEGGSYYASERALTLDNAKVVQRCLGADGKLTVDTIVDISEGGRAAKHEPALFALAIALGWPDDEVRTHALAQIGRVCRTGTHLFTLVGYVENFRGWGKGLQRAIGRWYLTKPVADLMYQVVKYKARNDWTHRDLLRLAKPGAKGRPGAERGSDMDKTLGWVVGKGPVGDELPAYLYAADQVMAGTLDPVTAIEVYNFPWEALPSEALAKPEVWAALAPKMPIGALVRNLGRMSANGAIKPMGKLSGVIAERLVNGEAVRRSRIHPLNVLTALSTYKAGRGLRGSLTWAADARIVAALEDMFKLAFANVVPSGKRHLIGLDVSGSMDSGNVAGSFLTPREAAVAMALVTVATEPLTHTMAFTGGFVPITLTPKTSLTSAIASVRHMPFDRTDCSLPMQYALEHGIEVDVFMVLTDSETWAGRIHPVQALRKYRERTGINAKLVVVGMVANEFSIADPADFGMLDVVGFDSAAPALIADFAAGRM
jgi:60 kDa SS-A/Ro ribonucleoprotein